MSYGRKDYPLAGKLRGPRGKALSDITLEAVLTGDAVIEDLRITPEALKAQADVARDAGRPRLADNFERAAELVNVPEERLMQVYELLRPGRARAKEELLHAAKSLRAEHGADEIARFIEEAAEVYEARGLFTRRF